MNILKDTSAQKKSEPYSPDFFISESFIKTVLLQILWKTVVSCNYYIDGSPKSEDGRKQRPDNRFFNTL